MKFSPMMTHYFEVKEKYKDCIVFYRLGDFYEMFFDDAIKVSAMLDLTLTGRDCGQEERAPMCGVPYHAADMYISKLVSLGEKVAICEQLTEPKEGERKLVERDVIKVVTAGTVTNNELISENENNFLACVYYKDNSASISWVDITTGEFFTREFCGENVLSEITDVLTRINPVEIICSLKAHEIFSDIPLVTHGVLPKFSTFIESEFNLNNAEITLKSHFNLNSLEIFKLEEKKICISSCGALIAYLNQTQKKTLKNITEIVLENGNDFMMLDVNAIRNLELVKTLRDNKRYGSLLWLLDKTKTSMGARKLQNWILTPLSSIESINYRLNGVEAFFNSTLVRQGLAELLSAVKDIERITGKISNGNLLPKDCLALARSLDVLPSIKFRLLGVVSDFVTDCVNNISDFTKIVTLLNSAIESDKDLPTNVKDGGFIKKGYNEELDTLRSLRDNSKNIVAQMELRERERTGIKTLKIKYNRVFGYYIEITNSFKDLVPYDYTRRQTLTNAERYVTDELKDLEVKILSSDERALQLELVLYSDIKKVLENYIEDLKNTAEAIANLDCLVALSTVAKNNGYVKPIIVDSNEELLITDGRHPVVEEVSKQRFVPNDCILNNTDSRMMILTGPNMAGKSTYMRQVALITLMAHIGSFVPAKSAKIPLTDKIFTRVGASDNLILDQSTFMVEMVETANILKNATEKSLVILDEIGRGTSTFDGLSIAWSVAECLTEKIKTKTLFATHYHELTELEGIMEGVKNYKVTVKEMGTGIIFMRKIMRGGTNKSFGIEVASLAGVDKSVTDRARQILKKLEKKDLKFDLEKIEDYQEKPQNTLSDVELIIKDIDVNNLTPMKAFNILIDLSEKVNEK